MSVFSFIKKKKNLYTHHGSFKVFNFFMFTSDARSSHVKEDDLEGTCS